MGVLPDGRIKPSIRQGKMSPNNLRRPSTVESGLNWSKLKLTLCSRAYLFFFFFFFFFFLPVFLTHLVKNKVLSWGWNDGGGASARYI